ncbi:ATP-dependent zinc metalloprotease FtsH [Novispirillum sp. DQ9]|uniref:ATP-dependent zinc metalloprotease FtsH n=1 Tax=Novispirillum sp. DQ9 TaxID=3398612 RepID=UPI003C7BBB6D
MRFLRPVILLPALAALVVLGALGVTLARPWVETTRLSYTAFIAQAEAGAFAAVTMRGQELSARTADGVEVTAEAPAVDSVVSRLAATGTDLTFDTPGITTAEVLKIVLPTLLIIGLLAFVVHRMGGGLVRGGASFASEARTGKTFADVAGAGEAKQDLLEIVDFLRDPGRYAGLGAAVPKGVLLSGPPGTGKTLLAKALAGEAGVPFLSVSGSDFVEMYVGLGAKRVRDLFKRARGQAPCIVFIDEIDAVGRARAGNNGGAQNDEREQTLNQLLVEMDGFAAGAGIVVVAATNRPDVLDDALLRPGRFDRRVVVGRPDLAGRREILDVHAAGKPLDGVDLDTVARSTPGFSGADLENLVNEAALWAARHNRPAVTPDDFEAARDKILMGAERKTLVMSPDERRLTAYHEAGHALMALCFPQSDPIHKATILPRGQALGMVMRMPERDRISLTLAQLKADLRVAVGGRVAEHLIFGPDFVTTGASSDIAQATDTAWRMVTEWGLSEKAGFLHYPAQGEAAGVLSAQASATINAEVRRIIDDAMADARTAMAGNLDALHRIAEALLDRETLTGAEIAALAEVRSLAA